MLVGDRWWPEPPVSTVAEITRLANRALTAEQQRDDALAEITRLRLVLMQIHDWDCLNPPADHSDFPWLKRLVDNALGLGSHGT